MTIAAAGQCVSVPAPGSPSERGTPVPRGGDPAALRRRIPLLVFVCLGPLVSWSRSTSPSVTATGGEASSSPTCPHLLSGQWRGRSNPVVQRIMAATRATVSAPLHQPLRPNRKHDITAPALDSPDPGGLFLRWQRENSVVPGRVLTLWTARVLSESSWHPGRAVRIESCYRINRAEPWSTPLSRLESTHGSCGETRRTTTAMFDRKSNAHGQPGTLGRHTSNSQQPARYRPAGRCRCLRRRVKE